MFGRHPYLKPEDAKLNEQQQMIKLFQRMTQVRPSLVLVLFQEPNFPASVPMPMFQSLSLSSNVGELSA